MIRLSYFIGTANGQQSYDMLTENRIAFVPTSDLKLRVIVRFNILEKFPAGVNFPYPFADITHG